MKNHVFLPPETAVSKEKFQKFALFPGNGRSAGKSNN
jgi:hypothetical protein